MNVVLPITKSLPGEGLPSNHMSDCPLQVSTIEANPVDQQSDPEANHEDSGGGGLPENTADHLMMQIKYPNIPKDPKDMNSNTCSTSNITETEDCQVTSIVDVRKKNCC